MIKIIKYNNNSGLKKLVKVLNERRKSDNSNIVLVKRIINDVKKNKLKALKKYEKKYSKNNQIKIPKKKN